MFSVIFQGQGGGGGAFSLIQDILLAADAASIDFQNIPTTFKHLKIITSLRTTRAVTQDNLSIRFNNDSGANYSSISFFLHHNGLVGDGELIGGTSGFAWGVPGAGSVANQFSAGELTIPDYLSTINQKSWVAPDFYSANDTTTNLFIFYCGGVWRSTVAINRITLLPSTSGNIASGSRASLYGMN